MNFHEFATFQARYLKVNSSREQRKAARQLGPDEVRKRFIEFAAGEHARAESDVERTRKQERVAQLESERIWIDLERPYYNVWPVASEISQGVKLDLPFSAFRPPFDCLVFRFAHGREPYGIAAALMCWYGNRIRVFANLTDGSRTLKLLWRYGDADVIENWIARLAADSQEWSPAGSFLVRLIVFVGLLAHDVDMITPVVFAKDQKRYDAATTDAEREWLERRAAKRMGERGFDLCKNLEYERSLSPHWRNPHFALCWVGPGRTKAELRWRRGSLVCRASMVEVPTGELGQETADDLIVGDDIAQREPISKSRRFAIMERDKFTCQLCGARREDGGVLNVDHKIPRAKGGSNEDSNLWTLCEACNLGKSDRLLAGDG